MAGHSTSAQPQPSDSPTSQAAGSASAARSVVPTAYAGIFFVVLFVAGVLIGGETPAYDASDQEWLGWFEDNGNLALATTGLFLLALAALALVVFIAGLATWLRQRAPTEEIARTSVLISGSAFALAVVVGAIGANQVAGAYVFGGDYELEVADVARQAEQIGYGVMLIGAAFFAALMIAAVTWAGTRAGALPGWLGALGWIASVILLLSVFFFPIVLLPIWTLAFSIWLVRSEARSRSTQQQPVLGRSA